jgi:hemerythrin-like domain-containing protein
VTASPTSTASPHADGFDVLDACHGQMVFTLGKLSALVARLAASGGPDTESRTLAREVLDFFDTTMRRHHEDEERHVFPALVAAGDPDTVQALLRLQQDHNWIEEDWMELQPHVASIAGGRSGYALEVLREGAAVFSALLHEHVALEESMIYPQARERLQDRARGDMGREMAARRRAERRPGRRAPA